MKRFTLAILLSFSFSLLILSACGGGGGGDQSTPEGTMNMVFDAARSGNYDQLKNLCDPQGENDGDTRRVCQAGENPEEFKKYFQDGAVKGSARIEGDKAEVDFNFGPGGSDSETMRMVQRDGKWYLMSF